MIFKSRYFLILLITVSNTLINRLYTSTKLKIPFTFNLVYTLDKAKTLDNIESLTAINVNYKDLIKRFKFILSTGALEQSKKNKPLTAAQVTAHCLLMFLIKWAQNGNKLVTVLPALTQFCKKPHTTTENFCNVLSLSLYDIFPKISLESFATEERLNLKQYIEKNFENKIDTDSTICALTEILSFNTNEMLNKHKDFEKNKNHSIESLKPIYQDLYPILQLPLFANWLTEFICIRHNLGTKKYKLKLLIIATLCIIVGAIVWKFLYKQSCSPQTFIKNDSNTTGHN